jgi:asparagine synthase (glutamine-hydrolysing)
LSQAEAAGLPDSAILLRAYRAWGDSVVDRIAGDYAFALWDSRRQRLLLARDPLGQRPLHYFRHERFIAFASMPIGLHALAEVPRAADAERVAELLGDVILTGSATYLKGISRLESGHLASVTRDGVRTRPFWSPPLGQLRLRDGREYVEAMREQVDRAVACRLRRYRGRIASHLSAGWDSGTVTATAARLMQGERLLAYTAAPREGFDATTIRGRVADESPYAARTVSLYPNIDHVIVRPTGRSPLGLLDLIHSQAQLPLSSPTNFTYWAAVNDRAAQAGAQVVLTGQYGNHTISTPGLGVMADLIRTGRWLRWAREANALAGGGRVRWRGVLATSFGPWMPHRVWLGLTRRFLGTSSRFGTPFLLRPRWAELVGASTGPRLDAHPARNSYLRRLRLLQTLDKGNSRKANLAIWGIDERDPTADRRLAEFCLSLPADQLLANGVSRPLARQALADRLPPQVLDAPLRGYQVADWYEAVDPEELSRHVDLIEGHPLCREMFDVEALRGMIARWPPGEWSSPHVVQEFRIALHAALAAAHFIRSAPTFGTVR